MNNEDKITLGRVGQEQFVVAEYRLLDSELIGSDEKILYLMLLRFKNKSQAYCYPSLQTLEDRLGWSRKTLLLKLNNFPKFVCSSNYIATLNGLEKEKVTCLLTGLDNELSGMKLQFKMNEYTYDVQTSLLMPYNALNILTALTTLEVLGVLNVNTFEKSLEKLVIPGRAEVFKVKDRLIVIDTHLPAMLDCLKVLKEQRKVNKIKVVVGSTGYGYKYWEERFKTEKFAKQRKEYRKYAMNLLKGIVDYVYLTESDNGKENAIDICNELQGYLDKNIDSVIIVDRAEAIKKAILDSQEKDVIFISGRGNRRLLCNSETTFKLVKDGDVVEKVIKELGW